MTNSRAPDLAEPHSPLERDAGPSPRAGVGGLFARPLAPLIAAATVVMMVVLAISTARSAGLIAALWGGGAVATAAWLKSGRGLSHDLAFGVLMILAFGVGNLLAGNGPETTLFFSVANTLEVVTGVLLIRQFAPELNLKSVSSASRFLLAGVVLAPIPAAILTAVVLQQTRGQDFLATAQTWWFGHAMGLAAIAPFWMSLTKKKLAGFARPMKMLETVVLLGLAGLAAWLVFASWQLPATFAVVPILILIAARLRLIGITAALIVVSLIAVGATLDGRGPFILEGVTRTQEVMLAQLFVLMGCLPTLLVAVLLDERDRLAARALAGQERAERASEGKSRLLANVAHEIKSPIGGVIGIGDLWSSGQLGPLTQTQAEMAEVLVKTARQVESLAHDLLDVARAEAGEVKVDLRPVDVGGVLDDVRRSAAAWPDAAGLVLRVERVGEDLIVRADSVRLSQVVSNLASNAVKYGASGGEVIFRAERRDQIIRIAVEDRGPGMGPEKQAQLFEPFNRLGLERSTIEGHGVGLAIAKRLVELQGGVIGVDSTPGRGSVFWIELPAA